MKKLFLVAIVCTMVLVGCDAASTTEDISYEKNLVETITETETGSKKIDISKQLIKTEPEKETEMKTEPATVPCNHVYEYWYGYTNDDDEYIVEEVCIYCGYIISHSADPEEDPGFDMDENSYLIPDEDMKVQE